MELQATSSLRSKPSPNDTSTPQRAGRQGHLSIVDSTLKNKRQTGQGTWKTLWAQTNEEPNRAETGARIKPLCANRYIWLGSGLSFRANLHWEAAAPRPQWWDVPCVLSFPTCFLLTWAGWVLKREIALQKVFHNQPGLEQNVTSGWTSLSLAGGTPGSHSGCCKVWVSGVGPEDGKEGTTSGV